MLLLGLSDFYFTGAEELWQKLSCFFQKFHVGLLDQSVRRLGLHGLTDLVQHLVLSLLMCDVTFSSKADMRAF